MDRTTFLRRAGALAAMVALQPRIAIESLAPRQVLTLFARTSFGYTDTFASARIVDMDKVIKKIEDDSLAEHRSLVAGKRIVRGPELIEDTPPWQDGRTFSWLTEYEEET